MSKEIFFKNFFAHLKLKLSSQSPKCPMVDWLVPGMHLSSNDDSAFIAKNLTSPSFNAHCK